MSANKKVLLANLPRIYRGRGWENMKSLSQMVWETVRDIVEKEYGLGMSNVEFWSTWGSRSVRVIVLGRQVINGRRRTIKLRSIRLVDSVGSLEQWERAIKNFVFHVREELTLAQADGVEWWEGRAFDIHPPRAGASDPEPA